MTDAHGDIQPEKDHEEDQIGGGAVQGVSKDGAIVRYFHALGTNFPTGKVLDHLSDETLVYLVGRHVACFQHENPMHRFILKSPKTSDIVTFCVSANRKYIALAERMTEGFQVNVYTQHTGSRVRSLDFQYLTKVPVVTMDFSTDNKYLAAATALPDVYIFLWQVDKARLLGMIDVPFEISRITISPWAYYTMCTTGPSTIKIWRLAEKNLKPIDPLPKRKDSVVTQAYRFTSHTWYDDEKLVAASEEGDILVVENSEVRKVIHRSAIHGEGHAITVVASVARGFICGGDGGLVSLFERTFDETSYFRLLRRFTSPASSRIVDLSVSPKEENAIACFENNTLGIVSMENVDVQKDTEGSQFSLLSCGFHNDAVTAVDVCVQKPIIVTGSLDKTVRVWNFMRQKLEFSKTFDEEVLCLSVHPTGLRMVIGFKSYTRMYNVLSQDLHYCGDLQVKSSYEVRFSHGGQYIAAVVQHRVLIFNSYDFSCLGHLSGHTVMIKSLWWSKNDQQITTAELNGIIYTWNVDTQKRNDSDDVKKNVSYSCVRYDDASEMTAAIGSCRLAEAGLAEGEITVRCISQGVEPRVVRPGVSTTKLPTQKKHHTAEIALSSLSQTLFVGTPTGNLLLYRWPLLEDAQPYQKYEVHNGEVFFVMLSCDERYLFTVGEDNAMFMFEVDAIIDGHPQSRKPFPYSTFEDVCYVLQSDVEDRTREISNLQQELEDLTLAKTREEANLIQRHEHESTQRMDEHTSQVAHLTRQLEQAVKQKAEAEAAMTDNTRHLELVHLKAAEELEAMYTKRTEEANARYQQLKVERDDLIVRYENKLYKVLKEQEAERKRIEDRHKEMELRLTGEVETLKKKLSQDSSVSNAMLDQAIVDYETMIDDLSAKHKAEMIRKEEELSRAINNGSTGERDSERLRKDKQALITQLQEKDKSIDDYKLQLEKKRKEIEALKKEMQVRYESISAAEKKIQQLKKQTTELEKLRYVLTFKFNELKKEVAPKDKQIQFMSTRVEEMDHELERVALDRDALKQGVEGKEEKLQVVQREIHAQHRGMEDKERVINTMLRELTELVSDTDNKRLVYRLKEVVMKYNTKHLREQVVMEKDRTAEFERQREYMETQLGCVKRQNKQKESNLRLENQRNTAENAILVKEINELRHEKKQLTSKCQVVESQLKEARVALQRATSATPGITPASQQQQRSSASPSQMRPHSEGANASGPPKGKLVRGPTRALRDIAQLDSDKIARIISQVERNNSEMERQEEEIQRLREFVQHLLSRAENDGTSMSAEESAKHSEIKRQLASTAPSGTFPSL